MKSHPGVDGMVLLGTTLAGPMLSMIDDRGYGGKIKIGTFDLSPEVLDGLTQGKVLFGIEIPRGVERAVRRGDHPSLLVAADATDPIAASSALSSLSVVVRSHGPSGKSLSTVRRHSLRF